MDKKPENSKIKMEFSDRLNEAIRERKKPDGKTYTNKELGGVAGKTEAAFSKFRTGKIMPSVETGIQLAVFLKVSFEWLMTGRGKKDVLPESRLDTLPQPVRDAVYDLIDQPPQVLDGFVKAFDIVRAAYKDGQQEGRS